MLKAMKGRGRIRARARLYARLTGAGTHLVLGLGIVALVFPWISPMRRGIIQQRWARRLLRHLGIRLELAETTSGTPLHAPALLVANHVTWLDVFVINAAAQATFVCKSEVRDWPLLGFLCHRAGTVFIERDRRSAARQVNQALTNLLVQGERIAVFPEGTTTDGNDLLDFRTALLQAAIDADGLVQPLALRYADRHGRLPKHFAYCGETTLWQSICAIAAAQDVTARLAVLDAIPATKRSRREIAGQARAAIGDALGLPINGTVQTG